MTFAYLRLLVNWDISITWWNEKAVVPSKPVITEQLPEVIKETVSDLPADYTAALTLSQSFE